MLVYPRGACNGNYLLGKREEKETKIRVSVLGRNGHDSEPYEAKYERYRKIYLATSPERELNTLNAALVNVRKWLKKKHECLKLIQGSSTTASPGPGTGASGAPPAFDNKLDTSSGADNKLGRKEAAERCGRFST
nr:hypothetical protein BaRGS_007033 [Batillaria attramentaria]